MRTEYHAPGRATNTTFAPGRQKLSRRHCWKNARHYCKMLFSFGKTLVGSSLKNVSEFSVVIRLLLDNNCKIFAFILQELKIYVKLNLNTSASGGLFPRLPLPPLFCHGPQDSVSEIENNVHILRLSLQTKRA
jgi:hypothetical protein